jgi:glutamyl-tRNA synthetase
MGVRTRFAPSPTGDLHLGGAWTALASWVTAHREPEGVVVLRVEDIDPPRVVAGAAARIQDDLRWLGLTWDEGPYWQSARSERYERAIEKLTAKGLVYPCDCSRADIARSASAPHPGEELVYPGTCRTLDPGRAMKRAPAFRVRVPEVTVTYQDGAVGTVAQNIGREVGDFVLRRGDGVFAYQLAVAVDDLAMGITDVVRGADLVGSTPRQIWLMSILEGMAPRFTHVPLVVAPDGARLEKRTGGMTIRELREGGVPAERIVGELSLGLGLANSPAHVTAEAIARSSSGRSIAWSQGPWSVPASLVGR